MGLVRRTMRWLATTADQVFADGLDTTAFLEHIERKFGIRISDGDGARIKTLGDLSEYVAARLDAQNRSLTDSEILAAVRRITSAEFGVRESELRRETRFVEDLMC